MIELGAGKDVPETAAVLITGGMVADAENLPRHCDLLIREGRIAAVGQLGEDAVRTLQSLPGVEVLDASGCFVLPGGIDPHTHLELTVGGEHVSDDFASGTLAALHGGTTSVIEHPSFAAPEDSRDVLHQMRLYLKMAQGKAFVDYGLHLVFQPPYPQPPYHILAEVGEKGGKKTGDDWPALAGLAEAVAQGYASGKAYTTYDGKLDDGQLLRLMAAMKETRCLLTVHAENDAIPAWIRTHGKLDSTDPRSHPVSRPAQCEAEAVTRVLALARCVGVPVYVVHVSTAAALEAIRAARNTGQTVYAETCPQYLLLTEDAYAEEDGLRYLMTPPLRTAHDVDALWRALADGTIDVVATDHCSFSLAQKRAKDSVFACPGGVPGVETRQPLLFTHGVLRQGLDMRRFAALASGNAARIFGLPNKGLLAPGKDADVLVLDPDARRSLDPESLHQRTDYCPFSRTGSGMAAGWPRHVLLGGRILIRDGLLADISPHGQFIRRTA